MQFFSKINFLYYNHSYLNYKNYEVLFCIHLSPGNFLMKIRHFWTIFQIMYCKMSYDITISNEIYHEFPNKLFPRNHSTSYVMERTYSYKYKLKTGGVRVVKQ